MGFLASFFSDWPSLAATSCNLVNLTCLIKPSRWLLMLYRIIVMCFVSLQEDGRSVVGGEWVSRGGRVCDVVSIIVSVDSPAGAEMNCDT